MSGKPVTCTEWLTCLHTHWLLNNIGIECTSEDSRNQRTAMILSANSWRRITQVHRLASQSASRSIHSCLRWHRWTPCCPLQSIIRLLEFHFQNAHPELVTISYGSLVQRVTHTHISFYVHIDGLTLGSTGR